MKRNYKCLTAVAVLLSGCSDDGVIISISHDKNYAYLSLRNRETFSHILNNNESMHKRCVFLVKIEAVVRKKLIFQAIPSPYLCSDNGVFKIKSRTLSSQEFVNLTVVSDAGVANTKLKF